MLDRFAKEAHFMATLSPLGLILGILIGAILFGCIFYSIKTNKANRIISSVSKLIMIIVNLLAVLMLIFLIFSNQFVLEEKVILGSIFGFFVAIMLYFSLIKENRKNK